MYSTFAFPGVKELNKKIKVLDVAAFISTFRVTLVNIKTQRRLLPGANPISARDTLSLRRPAHHLQRTV